MTNKSQCTWMGIDLSQNRWIFPVSGCLATSLVGAAYAFSVFVKPLEAEFAWERSQTTLAFSFAMFLFGFFTFVGGYIVDRFGPKMTFIVGGLMMALSQVLSSQINSIGGLILTYGILLGTGIGLVYGAVTVPLMTQWYPDKKNRGFAIGISLMGMGLGGLIAAPVWSACIESFGWRSTYMGTGVIFVAVLGIVASIIRYPTSDLKFDEEKGWIVTETSHSDSKKRSKVIPDSDFRFGEALQSPYLWLMGFLFFLTIFGGLMVVSQLKAFAVEAVPAGAGLPEKTATALVMALAVCNGLGRPSWGFLSGKVGIKNCLIICPLIMGLSMAILAFGSGSFVIGLGAICCGFAFGGTLALVPIMTAALFGSTFVGRIYGVVYLIGFGLGGFFGPPVGGKIQEVTGSYDTAFLISVGMTVLAAILSVVFLPSAGKEQLSRPSLAIAAEAEPA